MLCSVKKHLGSSSRFLRALQQNRAQPRLLNMLNIFVNQYFKKTEFGVVVLVVRPHPVCCVMNAPGVLTFPLVKLLANTCTLSLQKKNVFIQ